jgi:serine/threonine protein kinase
MEEKTFYKRVEYNSIETNYDIPEKCIKQYENLNINKKLGEGSHGVVYNACVKKDCKYVLKVIPLNVIIPSKYCDLKVKEGLLKCREVSDKEFDDEVKYSIIVSKANIGPKVYKSWKCDNVKSQVHLELFKMKEIKMGFILMEKLEMTLINYLSNYEIDEKIIDKIKVMYIKLIDKMVKLNIYNEDLHFENVMINLKNNILTKMRFIDWGSITIFDSDQEETYKNSGIGEFKSSLKLAERYMLKNRAIAKAFEKCRIDNWKLETKMISGSMEPEILIDLTSNKKIKTGDDVLYAYKLYIDKDNFKVKYMDEFEDEEYITISVKPKGCWKDVYNEMKKLKY